MNERLTRENRYVRAGSLRAEENADFGLGASFAPDVLRCRSCGSLVATGSEDLHETVHLEPPAESAADRLARIEERLAVLEPRPLQPGETRTFPNGNSVHMHVAIGPCSCGRVIQPGGNGASASVPGPWIGGTGGRL